MSSSRGNVEAPASSESSVVRVLHLEDDPNDADLVASVLSEAGLGCELTQVATESRFREMLAGGAFDLILADDSLSSFDGLSALRLARRETPAIPFILLSGTPGEERAVEAMKNGATDYLLKDRLSGLGASVKWALREAERCRERQEAAIVDGATSSRLASALHASGIGIWSWDADDDCFECDERICDLLGTATTGDLSNLGAFLARIHETDRDRIEATLMDSMRQESQFQFEFRLAVEGDNHRFVATRGQFLPEQQGSASRALGACWDVTDEKREQAQRRLLSAVLESAVNAVMITDVEGRISWVNAAFTDLTGYGAQEAIGQNPRLLKSGKHDEAFYKKMWATIASGNTWHGQLVNRRKNGSLYTEETTILPVLGDYGEITSFVCIKRDISLEMDLTRQLHQAQRLEAVGRLAAGVAHDFNNILTVISGNAELALSDLAPDEPTTAALEEISEASRRAVALTRQLLAFSRKQILQPQVLDLNALVSGTEKMLRRLIGEDVTLHTRLQPGLAAIEADPGQLEQIIMNLAVNARDAMPRGGRLEFITENIDVYESYPGLGGIQVHSGPYVRLTVRDTGEGMDEETQSRVFEPFFTTKEKGKGTGLGLSTVYGIVKQSGGYIEVESAPGKGTSFTIDFPRACEAPDPTPPSSSSQATVGGESILVVEDDPNLLRLASSILERGGYEVLAAGSAAEALQLVQSHGTKVQLLLTDVVMPRMSGRALAEQICAQNPKTRVLYTSGYSDDDVSDRGVLEPGISLLEKPYNRSTLLEAVRRVLDAKA